MTALQGTALATAPAASATTVTGSGNGTSDNTCANHSAGPHGRADRSPGAVGGLHAALSVGLPGNQCGDLGLPHEDSREEHPE
ncbi:hypothetical protein ACSNOK_28845 [Streptomyces sp. URMC 126]|uniref:hypothetical protein n=1 Tax=Streptomyces sp. URMC 126 TaxID=3423401 RepID=UPI003F1C36C3